MTRTLQGKQNRGRRNFKNARLQEAIARIEYLWSAAKSLRRALPTASRNYVLLLKKIATRVNHRLDPDELKRHICRRCGSILQLGSNAWVRVRYRLLILHCKSCGCFRRFPLRSKPSGRDSAAAIVVRTSAIEVTPACRETDRELAAMSAV
ncbi:hypothetical protein CCYA_CCYA11G3081 [Cyanidiococcus yangmingshanensis]|nr:hypothetical protein CCYA_CCYA11G3081 [Cyanidiococcus yangmingshanensis]